MLTRRKLALLAVVAVITGLIAGPAIAGGGDSPEPAAPAVPEAPAAELAGPESVESETDEPTHEEGDDPDANGPGEPTHDELGSDHNLNEICTSDWMGFPGDHPEGFDELGPFDESEISPEKLEELHAGLEGELEKFDELPPAEFKAMLEGDLDALAELLTEKGLTVEKTTAEDGSSCLSIDGDPEAIDAVIDEALDDMFGEFDELELAGEHFDELPPEAIDEINAEMQELAAHFDANGIEYEIVEEGDLRLVEWDETNEEANAAAEEFFGDRADEFPFFEHELECDEVEAR